MNYMEQTIKARCPFQGFYDWFSYQCDEAFKNDVEYYLQEEGYNIPYDGFRHWFWSEIGVDDYDFAKCKEEYAQKHVEVCNDILGMNLKYQGIWSPREYNFTNDDIDVLISPHDLKVLRDYVLCHERETAEKLIGKWMMPRSGFIPFHSNKLDDPEWSQEEWGEVKIELALQVQLIRELGVEGSDDMHNALYEQVMSDWYYPFTEEEIVAMARKAIGHDFLNHTHERKAVAV